MTVIGLGYLGVTHAVAMAELGHEVIGLEADPKRLAALQARKLPFHEPGLDEALTRALATGRISFQATHAEITRDAMKKQADETWLLPSTLRAMP